MNTEIPTFDINKINRGSIHIIGRRGTGKTTLINDILKTHDTHKKALVMCNLCDKYNDYNTINGFDKHEFNFLYEQQIKDYTQKAFIVLDNVIQSPNIIIFDFNVFNIINLLYISSYTSSLSVNQNTNYTFIFNVNNYDERQTLYRKYFYRFYLEYENFNNAFNMLKAYECFVIDHITNELYLYKANIEVKLTDCIR